MPVINLFSVFPAPFVFGAAIDSACILFDSKCGVDGRCKLYNHGDFRLRLHGGVLFVKMIATLFYLTGWYFSRKHADFYENIERMNNRKAAEKRSQQDDTGEKEADILEAQPI